MAVLKTQCPQCDAKIRLTVAGTGSQTAECLKCGHSFTAKAVAEDAETKNGPASKNTAVLKETTKASAKKSKALARHDDDDDDAPKKKKKKGAQADGKKNQLIFAGVAAGVLLVGGLGAVIYAMSNKDKDTAKSPDTPATTTPAQTTPPAGTPPKGPAPKIFTKDNTGETGPGPKIGPTDPVKPPVESPLKKKMRPAEEAFLAKLANPPKLKVEGTLVTEEKALVVKPPAFVPLAPDEDPFVRSKDFKLEEKLPDLPKLPDRRERPVLTFDSGGHTAFVMKVFFTPDGKRVITVAQDKTVRIWDPITNETIKTLRFPTGPGDEGSLNAAALDRAGKKLAVAGVPLKDSKGEVKSGKVPIFIVSPETGALLKRIDAGSDIVTCLHFSNDGKRLAVGCADSVLQVFDTTSGQQVLGQTAPGINGILGVGGFEVKFNPLPNTNYLASLTRDSKGGRVLLVDLKTKKASEFAVTAGPPNTLAWRNDGQELAVGCSNGAVAFYGLDGKPRVTFPAITAEIDTSKGKAKVPVKINELAYVGTDLAVVGSPRFAAVVDGGSGKVRTALTAHPNLVTAVDVSPDGTQIASCGGHHHDTVIWSAADGKVLNRLAGAGAVIQALAWSKDGRSIAWGNSERAPGEEEFPLEHMFRLDELGLGGKPDPDKYVQTVKSDEGVGLIVERAAKGSIFLVQTPGRDPALLGIRGETIYSATLLPKSNAIVAGGIADIYLINPATLKPSSNTFVGHTGNVLCVTPSPDGRYFATGSTDQTIRIWRRDQEEPILSIFVAGREWVAWTPQGYYACSPQGERLMAWQVNAAPGAAAKGPQIHPAERFRSSLYQPALLKYVVPAGDLQRAMAMAKKYDKALFETKNIADVLPPEVTLEGFTDEAEVKIDKDTLTVKATAKGTRHAVTSMRLLVDGRPFQGSAGVKKFANPQPNTDVTATWEVPLIPGTHTFAVIADTGVSRGMSKLGTAIRSGTPPKPNLYVLAMGVSEYPAGVNSLNFCATDAQMLVKAFQEHSTPLFGKMEVKLLTNKQCTTKGMLEGLDWLKARMTPQDVGVVSFSGHGTRDPFGRFYLVSADIDPDDSERTCLPGDVFKDRLDNMPGRLVAILDACHSGMAGKDGKTSARADGLVRDLTAEDSGVIVMSASLGRETAAESPLCKAGFYTLGLVEGMGGLADIDGDGVVYLHELDLYATMRVRQLSDGRQNPTFSRPASIRPFPIAKPAKPPAKPPA